MRGDPKNEEMKRRENSLPAVDLLEQLLLGWEFGVGGPENEGLAAHVACGMWHVCMLYCMRGVVKCREDDREREE